MRPRVRRHRNKYFDVDLCNSIVGFVAIGYHSDDDAAVTKVRNFFCKTTFE